jgi:hypothetical protein
MVSDRAFRPARWRRAGLERWFFQKRGSKLNQNFSHFWAQQPVASKRIFTNQKRAGTDFFQKRGSKLNQNFSHF